MKYLKIYALLVLLLMAGGVTMQAQNSKSNRELPEQYWVDIVTEQPEGYVVDANGDVHIYSAEALAWLSVVSNGFNGQEIDDYEGRTVCLEDNIDLSGALWLPIAGKVDVSAVFHGYFDGKEHVIEGLTMTSGYPYFYMMGLFGELSGATLSNIVLTKGYYEAQLTGGNYEGGFLACAVRDESLVNHCFVDCEMHIKSGMSPFVYECEHSTISNCLVHSPLIRAEGSLDGIPGILVAIAYPKSHILNCASIIERMDWSENCGLVGIFNYGIIENCYGYIGECIDFGGYGGGPAPRNGVTGSNGPTGEIYNCYYNRLRNYVGSSYYIEMDDQPAYSNLGIIQNAVPYTEEGRGHWKLTEEITFELENGTVSTNDLLDALNFKVRLLYDEALLDWCDTGMGFDNQQLPVFCNFDVTETSENTTSVDQVEVYPNPARAKVTIEGLEAAKVQVYNALGQLVKTVQCSNEINVSGLAEGVYLLRITDAEGKSHTARLVVKE